MIRRSSTGGLPPGDLSDTRHRGHVVNDCYPEPPGAPLENPTRKSYEQFLDDIAARGYTRFQANGPVLEVDVTDLSELDFPRLMGSLTGFVQRAVPGYPLRLPTLKCTISPEMISCPGLSGI